MACSYCLGEYKSECTLGLGRGSWLARHGLVYKQKPFSSGVLQQCIVTGASLNPTCVAAGSASPPPASSAAMFALSTDRLDASASSSRLRGIGGRSLKPLRSGESNVPAHLICSSWQMQEQ